MLLMGHNVTDFLTIEPAPEQASAFAVWLLSRYPQVQTVSAGGFLVPLDLYPDVPSELLIGAYVDGYPYRHVIDGMAPDGRGYKAEVPVDDGAQPEPLTAPLGYTKNGTPRKRRAPATDRAEVTE